MSVIDYCIWKKYVYGEHFHFSIVIWFENTSDPKGPARASASTVDAVMMRDCFTSITL